LHLLKTNLRKCNVFVGGANGCGEKRTLCKFSPADCATKLDAHGGRGEIRFKVPPKTVYPARFKGHGHDDNEIKLQDTKLREVARARAFEDEIRSNA